MCDTSSHDEPLTAEEAGGGGRGQTVSRAARGSRFRSSGAARGGEGGGEGSVYLEEGGDGDSIASGEVDGGGREVGADVPFAEGSDALVDKVLGVLVRQRITLAEISERVSLEMERMERDAAVREEQLQLKEAEEEANRANEAAIGARCEESGHVKAASKAKTAQEEERAKMLELLTEDVAHVEEMEEADMLQRLEDLIVKGDEARSALTVLQHMPRSTKGTQMHMEYEESLVKARLRGERAAAAMDAFQGFAAQVARSEKARAEASTRAQWAEKERGRLQQRLVQVQGALDQVKAELAQCRASTPHLCEWLHEHRQRGVGPGGCMRLSKLLQDEVRQRLDKF